ncbi:MAG: epoxide hydrolase family protein [Pseudolysinimonas sp.]|uniref:epoxide hydrolase family protein n=1 Tax=Pseudolysinimonas sp. TaxID=2680009 RepID=UPI0032632CF3
MSARIEPFTIQVEDDILTDLHDRLTRTRRAPVSVADDWSRGIPPAALNRVLAHWAGAYDWRAAEERLNRFDQVRVTVPTPSGHDLGVHVVRAGTRGATPLLLLHGWPDGFVRFEKALPLLAERFELIVPSIPGFGFSDKPHEALGPVGVAEVFAAVMTELGHDRFGVHGADLGSQIGEQLALICPERLLGLHLGDIPLRRLRSLLTGNPADLSDGDRDWLARLSDWETAEGAYARLQRTKPQTIGAALDDSPAGFAAWIVEKFQAWSDGDVFDVYTLDELCTNLTIYWVTASATSAAQYYYDNGHSTLSEAPVTVPTGVSVWPGDLVPGPRASAEHWFPIVRWTELPRGGHFGPWEQPALWADDVIAFFNQVGA